MLQVEIMVAGQLDGDWSDWLGNLAITHTAAGETLIRGEVRDQSATYGLLHRLSRLGLPLISVTCQGALITDRQGGPLNVISEG